MINKLENSIAIGPNPLKSGLMGALPVALIVGLLSFDYIAKLTYNSRTASSDTDFSTALFYFGAIMALVYLIAFLFLYSTAKKTLYGFTSEGISYSEGFLTINKKTIPYDRITDMNFVKRFPVDHIFNTGTIQFSSAGGGSGIRLKFIDNAESVFDDIRNVVKGFTVKGQMEEPVANPASQPSLVTADSQSEAYEIRPLTKPTVVKKLASMGLVMLFVFAPMFIIAILFSANASLKGNMPTFWLFVGGFLSIVILSMLIQLYFEYKNIKAKKYQFFADRVEYEEGFLTIRKMTIQYRRITDVSYSKGWFWDKIFDVSSIVLNTAGSSGHEMVMRDIPNAEQHYDHLKDLIKKIGPSQAGSV
jgi:membrane protein YdbS with pleckstrin-like domain